MEIKGKIIRVLPIASGTSRNGNQWLKQDYVLETSEQYPKKVLFSVFGEGATKEVFSVGQEVTASIDIESHEYNGRWFTNVKAWKVVATANTPQAQPAQPQSQPQPAQPQTLQQQNVFSGDDMGYSETPF